MARTAWAAGIGALLLAACALAPPAAPLPRTGGVPLYLVRRTWHTDIGFRVTDIQPPLSSVLVHFPGAASILFGFGDRHYVLSKDKTFLEMLAALLPGQGLVLATGLTVLPESAFGAAQVIEFDVAPAQALAAQRFVWESLRTTADGQAQTFGPGPYQGGLYLESVKRYDFVHTCNTWTAEAAAAGGLPIRSTGVLVASQLWAEARDARASGREGDLGEAPVTPLAAP